MSFCPLVCKITITLMTRKDVHLFHVPTAMDNIACAVTRTCLSMEDATVVPWFGSFDFGITSIIEGAANAKVSQSDTIY